MTSAWLTTAGLLALSAALAACAGPPPDESGVDDAGPDATVDGGIDAAVDADPCGPPLHLEQQCTECETDAPCQPVCQDACVPADDLCPFSCPAGTTCRQVAALGYDIANLVGETRPACVATGTTVCDASSCPDGTLCEAYCHPCVDPGCEWTDCEPTCVDQSCHALVCSTSALCFDDPVVDEFGRALARRDYQSTACELTLCWPGTTCEEACVSPDACVSTCTTTCAAPADDACRGPITCGQPAPPCPAGTVPGIDAGCWAGYCIPEAQCTHVCAGQPEAACGADALCRKRFHSVCEIPPGGGIVVCHIEFDVCAPAPVAVTPMQGPWVP